jgi:hypothetical protein
VWLIILILMYMTFQQLTALQFSGLFVIILTCTTATTAAATTTTTCFYFLRLEVV